MMAPHQPGLVDGWNGPMRRYDLLKEAAVATVVVAALALGLAVVFGSPRRTAVTLQDWAIADPTGMAATTLAELDGTSATATYGPPYTSDGSNSQTLLGISPARIIGVTTPLDPAEDFILIPLSTFGPNDAELASAIVAFRAASPAEVDTWAHRYRSALATAAIVKGVPALAPGDYGPLVTLVDAVVTRARAGAFTSGLIDGQGSRPAYYALDTTRSTMFLADGDYFSQLATQAGLAGNQWGAMSTLHNWPGQWWLALFSLWYQFPPGSTSANADLLIAALMGALTLGFLLLPWIPGLRSLPSRRRFDRLVWHNRGEPTAPIPDRPARGRTR
jgi:hypothetical protein